MATQTIFENVALVPHPIARNAAVATHAISAGATIISVPALSTVLLSKEKGLRCDVCHRAQVDQSEFTLRKCSGCSSYWYCGEFCERNVPLQCSSVFISGQVKGRNGSRITNKSANRTTNMCPQSITGLFQRIRSWIHFF